MKRALLLVDLQHDFLATEGLEPAPGAVLAGATRALEHARRAGDLVVHVRTSVSKDDDRRMPHWRQAGRWACEVGTAGHAFADEVQPQPGEAIIDKTTFSPFVGPELLELLRSNEVTAVAIGGVHLHACVRQTALDAYQRGFETTILEDAVGSAEPLHAATTRRYLERRAVRFSTGLDAAAHHETDRTSLDAALSRLEDAQVIWSATKREARIAAVEAIAERLESASERLADAIIEAVSKPLAMARGEVAYAVALARATAKQVRDQPLMTAVSARAQVGFRPLGTVLALTPYNNPVAIPIGKIAPAIGFGNVVLWKPAPLGQPVAEQVMEVLGGALGDALELVAGDSQLSRLLIDDPRVDAVTLSGSSASGHAAAELCLRRRIPLQAELGGNNGAIVWRDGDLDRAAAAIAFGAFGFAGQRCTANRRVIADAAIHDALVERLCAATARLGAGDLRASDTVLCPLVSAEHAARVREVIARARAAGAIVYEPHPVRRDDPAWVAPAIVTGIDPPQEIVTEETFGPLLVVQRAEGFEHALTLLDGVEQGLVASLFSTSDAHRRRFLAAARAGTLKLDQSTVGAEAGLPFGGWKASGIGPPEHGLGDAMFYLRPQTILGNPGCR